MNEAATRPRGGNGKAIVIGILAMILGAGLWAVVTVVTEHEFSLVAIGVGALVGLTMFAARPTSSGIAVAAALLTAVGCALGEFLAIPAYVAHKDGLAFGKLINLELHHPKLYFDSLDGKTYLFWAIGAVAAFSMVFRRIQAARSAYGTPPAVPRQPAYGPPQQARPAAPPQAYGPPSQARPATPPQAYGPPQQAGPATPPQAYGPPQQQPYGPQPGQGQQYPPR